MQKCIEKSLLYLVSLMVGQLFDRLFLPAKKAEIETVRNGKCDECCVQQKDSDMYEKNYDLCDVHIF